MSDTVNPWQSPAAAVKAEENAAQGVLTAGMIRCLKEASPWLRFIGILGYIGAVSFIVIGIILVITMFAAGTVQTGIPGVLSSFMGLIYLVSGALAFFPARFTHRFGAKIRNYLLSGAEKDLEEAFRNNRSLWKFAGIVAIVYLSLIPVGIIVAVIVSLSSIL
jgi:hypothetical protein